MIDVVCCKECEYWVHTGYDPILNTEFGECYCYQWVSTSDDEYPETMAKDFCSFGRREKDE